MTGSSLGLYPYEAGAAKRVKSVLNDWSRLAAIIALQPEIRSLPIVSEYFAMRKLPSYLSAVGELKRNAIPCS